MRLGCYHLIFIAYPVAVLLTCLDVLALLFFFFKQKTAYEIRPRDWSSDVCSSDLIIDGFEK